MNNTPKPKYSYFNEVSKRREQQKCRSLVDKALGKAALTNSFTPKMTEVCCLIINSVYIIKFSVVFMESEMMFVSCVAFNT